VVLLVQNYGDGSPGPTGQGKRARGFDVDSKVQVFETVIRGLGGLLSAHLFAIGELPVDGYDPQGKQTRPRYESQQPRNSQKPKNDLMWRIPTKENNWSEFTYDGQLLHLALDLGKRLLPAFGTSTGLPYPRVNLRHGIPFYENSPLYDASEAGRYGTCGGDRPEITETCSAGAGSLVLEMTVLSRLTGDSRFEELGKRAFWAVWDRRSSIDIIGSGVDAESGLWVQHITGVSLSFFPVD
jgi:Glycosyl hydrolase family 47